MDEKPMCLWHKAMEVRLEALCTKLEEKESHLRIETELKIKNLMTEEFNNRLRHLEAVGLVREGKRSVSDWLIMGIIAALVTAAIHWVFKL